MLFISLISLVSLIIYYCLRGQKEWHQDFTALAHSKIYIWIIVIVSIILLSYLFIINGVRTDLWPVGYTDSDFFSKFIDPWIAILTFLIAAIIGLMNMRRQWEDTLPHTFTVHYCYNNRIYASFFDAKVISQHDIRNMAQSLGREINGGDLALTTHNTLIGPNIERTIIRKDNESGYDVSKGMTLYVKRWLYIMRLDKPPNTEFNLKTENKTETENETEPKTKTDTLSTESFVKVDYMAYTIDEDEHNSHAIQGYYIESDPEIQKNILFKEAYWRANLKDVKEHFRKYIPPDAHCPTHSYF